jgi:hypothetical protein
VCLISDPARSERYIRFFSNGLRSADGRIPVMRSGPDVVNNQMGPTLFSCGGPRPVIYATDIDSGQNSVLGTATRYSLRPGRFGVQTPVGAKRLRLLHSRPYRPYGPPSLLCNGYRGSFPRVKRPERGVDHPPPSSAQVKNVYSYTSTPSLWLQWHVTG